MRIPVNGMGTTGSGMSVCASISPATSALSVTKTRPRIFRALSSQRRRCLKAGVWGCGSVRSKAISTPAGVFVHAATTLFMTSSGAVWINQRSCGMLVRNRRAYFPSNALRLRNRDKRFRAERLWRAATVYPGIGHVCRADSVANGKCVPVIGQKQRGCKPSAEEQVIRCDV